MLARTSGNKKVKGIDIPYDQDERKKKKAKADHEKTAKPTNILQVEG